MSKKHWSKVLKIWYIAIYGCVLNGPILFGKVDSVENHVSAVNHKGVII